MVATPRTLLDRRSHPTMATWGYDHNGLVARPKGAPKVGMVDKAEPISLSGLGYASVATRVGSVATRATMATTWLIAAVATNPTTRRPDNQGISWSLVIASLGSDVAPYRKPRPGNNHGRRLPWRRYGRKYGCDPAGRGAHLHANWSFSPPPTLMAMKLPTIGNHI